jgi:hypothetical protein
VIPHCDFAPEVEHIITKCAYLFEFRGGTRAISAKYRFKVLPAIPVRNDGSIVVKRHVF